MKRVIKTFAVSAACLSLSSAAQAGAVGALSSTALGASYGSVCEQVYEVEKMHNGQVTTFDVTVLFKTPNMPNFMTSGTYNMMQADVTPFAVKNANRLCAVSADPNRLDDPCDIVEFEIEGGLFGYGTVICP